MRTGLDVLQQQARGPGSTKLIRFCLSLLVSPSEGMGVFGELGKSPKEQRTAKQDFSFPGKRLVTLGRSWKLLAWCMDNKRLLQQEICRWFWKAMGRFFCCTEVNIWGIHL